MTSHDRVLAALEGRPPDRVPVGPFVGSGAAPLIGASLREYYTNGVTIARAQVALRDRVGHDILVTAADTYYIAEALGLRTTHHDNALPTSDGPILTSLDQVDGLRVPDPQTGGRMPVYLAALDEMRALDGGRSVLRGTGTGPFSLAAYLFGEQEFLLMLAELSIGERPESDRRAVHRLLDLLADTTIAFLLAQIDRGAELAYMGDSLASSEATSPDLYREFAFPYHRKVFETVKEKSRGRGVYTLLHICGNNTLVMKDFARTGADLIEIDHKMNLPDCRSMLGPDIVMIGNLDPVHTLLEGTPEMVREKSTAAIRASRGADGGFILGSGCFVPMHTPVENLIAMVDASKRMAEEE